MRIAAPARPVFAVNDLDRMHFQLAFRETCRKRCFYGNGFRLSPTDVQHPGSRPQKQFVANMPRFRRLHQSRIENIFALLTVSGAPSDHVTAYEHRVLGPRWFLAGLDCQSSGGKICQPEHASSSR